MSVRDLTARRQPALVATARIVVNMMGMTAKVRDVLGKIAMITGFISGPIAFPWDASVRTVIRKRANALVSTVGRLDILLNWISRG